MLWNGAFYCHAVCNGLVRWAQEGSPTAARMFPSVAPTVHAHQPWWQRYGSALRPALPLRDYDHLLPSGWGLGSGTGASEGPSTTAQASAGVFSHLLPRGWGSGAKAGIERQDAVHRGFAAAFGRLLPPGWGSLLGRTGAEGQGGAGGPPAGATAKPLYGAPVPWR